MSTLSRRASRLFQCLYKLGGLVSSSRHHSPVYYPNALLAKKLKHYLDTHHYDIIVTPHIFSCTDTDLYEGKEPVVPENRGYRNRLYLYSILGGNRLRLLHHPSL